MSTSALCIVDPKFTLVLAIYYDGGLKQRLSLLAVVRMTAALYQEHTIIVSDPACICVNVAKQ